MKRRELFKMFATLAAVPFVAPLVALCKPKPKISFGGKMLSSGPLVTNSMAMDNFSNWPHDAQKHVLDTIGSYGDGESSDMSFLRMSLSRFWETAFRYHDAEKILMESPTIVQALDCLRGEMRIPQDSIYGCRFERWINPHGTVLIPDGKVPSQIQLTHKNTIYETNYPNELAMVQRDLAALLFDNGEES